jgi:hypothetical protein
VKLIEINPDIDQILIKARKKIDELGIGDMPPIEHYDDSFITEPISEIKH